MNIWIAAADGNLEKVTAYLEIEGLSPNSKDANGYSPMHAASEYGHFNVVQYLVSKGGDINIRDSDGDTPLHAVETAAAAEFLIKELGADVSVKNKASQTPLEKAEEEGDFPELIAYLKQYDTSDKNSQINELPENMSVSLTYEDEQPTQNLSPADRQKLGEIIEHGTDAEFESFLKEAIERNTAAGNYPDANTSRNKSAKLS